MTYKEALEKVTECGLNIEEPLHSEVMEFVCETLKKQIPKKTYKRKEHKQNDYYCSVCKCYLGDETEIKYGFILPSFCEHCGQALDWSDTE